ncbi:2'-5' RNA ligase family protein [Streptomyces sp. NPDC085900]|uniref:2'-5' RNA ligase family protein n=1 Tax=Streptomyces sp. NPDC085900 TaxID=3365737 RepID=UPI0037D079B5
MVTEALSAVAPFTAELRGVRWFRHRSYATVWLNPAAASPAPWARLYGELVERFPRCHNRARGFTPHLSLGRTRQPRELAAELSARLGSHSVLVRELVLLSRREDGPMQPRATFALGTSELGRD